MSINCHVIMCPLNPLILECYQRRMNSAVKLKSLLLLSILFDTLQDVIKVLEKTYCIQPMQLCYDALEIESMYKSPLIIFHLIDHHSIYVLVNRHFHHVCAVS